VTGVQTCALPISRPDRDRAECGRDADGGAGDVERSGRGGADDRHGDLLLDGAPSRQKAGHVLAKYGLDYHIISRLCLLCEIRAIECLIPLWIPSTVASSPRCRRTDGAPMS